MLRTTPNIHVDIAGQQPHHKRRQQPKTRAATRCRPERSTRPEDHHQRAVGECRARWSAPQLTLAGLVDVLMTRRTSMDVSRRSGPERSQPDPIPGPR